MKQKYLTCTLIIAIIFTVSAGCDSSGAQKNIIHKNKSTDAVQSLLSVKRMREDFSILFDAVKEMHPAYGLYTSPDSLHNIYSSIERSINHPLSEDELITAIYPFVSALKCGHTQIKHSGNYKPYSGDKAFRLPFEVLVQNNKAMITTHKVKALSTGDEILNVNGVPVAEIIKHGSDLYAMDGNNKSFKELFLSEYDGFEDAFNKYYRWTPPYSIRIRAVNGAIKSLMIDTVSSNAAQVEPNAVVDNYKGWEVSANTRYLPLRFLANASTACFEVHTYQYGDTTLYERAFKEIQKRRVENLIIDLRHNTGGDVRIASKLLTYLANSPFQMVGDVWARVPDPAKTKFEPYFDKELSNSFSQSFEPTGIQKDGHYQVKFRPAFGNLLGKIALNKKFHYTGKLYVLIDGATFSSGAHTAAAIRQNCRNVIFLGRETAGGSEGCSGGTVQHLTLPNTGVKIDFPLLRLVSVLKRPTKGHGLLPDITVQYTPLDVVTHNDPDLQRALRMIKRTAANN